MAGEVDRPSLLRLLETSWKPPGETRRKLGARKGLRWADSTVSRNPLQRYARRSFEESLALAHETLDPIGCAAALCNIGIVEVLTGEPQVAESSLRQGLTIAIEEGHRQGETIVRLWLGIAAADQGNVDEAREFLATSLEIAEEVHDSESVAENLEELARLAATLEEPLVGAFLLGAADQIREALNIGPGSDLDRRRQATHELIRAMSGEAYTRSYDEGMSTTEREAIDYALRNVPASRR